MVERASNAMLESVLAESMVFFTNAVPPPRRVLFSKQATPMRFPNNVLWSR